LGEIEQEIFRSFPNDIGEEFFFEEKLDRRWLELEEERSRGTPGDAEADTILAALPPALRNEIVL
jgi:hypothetical protein